MAEEEEEPEVEATEVKVAETAPASDGMSIPIPAGFQPPEGTKDGDTFEVIAKAKVMDGRLMFESFDGQQIEAEPETADESDAMAENALRDAMKTGGLRG